MKHMTIPTRIPIGISIIIPAYDEEEKLADRLEEITCYMKQEGHDYEIIIVDDGSADGTGDIARSYASKDNNILLLHNERNMGKGYSVKRGVLLSSKELILFTDADKSTPICELDRMIDAISQHDIAIGSRRLKDSKIMKRQPVNREVLGKASNLLIRLFAAPGIKDTQCGFKLFSRKGAAIFCKQTLDGWGFDFEILLLARKAGLSIAEVPISWTNDERTKLNPKEYLKTFFELSKVVLNRMRGKYD